jgi:hypothetical protein
LSVSLETVRQPEPLSCQSIKNALAQVAERRVAKIMSVRRRLHYDMIKTAETMKQIMILSAE